MKLIIGLMLASGLSLHAAAPIPRVAPEFKIHEPSGKDVMLSAQKGKVTVIQFLFTWCGHCQATAQWLSKMQTELGPKGVEVYGVAFNDEVLTKDTAANNKLVSAFSQYASFPVGIVTTKDPVLRFLGLSVMDAYGVPQLVVIDKKGAIRAQTPLRPGAGSIVEERVMRETVNKLLGEK
jgi:thiol-disulfide isomerase/thioredoxin